MSGQDPYKYYRPYDSADESGADSDTDTTDSWYSSSTEDQDQAPPIGEDGVPNFRAFASQMQLRDAAGPVLHRQVLRRWQRRLRPGRADVVH